MKRKRFTEEQIIGILKEAEAGAKGADLCRVGHKQATEPIALSPALQRLHAVFRMDRLPVMPPEAVPERERVLHAVVGHDCLVDPLRFDLEVLVGTEQRVVHEVTVVARDIGSRPDRIKDPQIRFRRETRVCRPFCAWATGAPIASAAAAAPPRTRRRLIGFIVEPLPPADTTQSGGV
jgi:hypothetical protein